MNIQKLYLCSLLIFFSLFEETLAFEFQEEFVISEAQIPYEIYTISSNIGANELPEAVSVWNRYSNIFAEPKIDIKPPKYRDNRNDFLGVLSDEEYKLYTDNECSYGDNIAQYCPERKLGFLHFPRVGEIAINNNSFISSESLFIKIALLHEIAHGLGMGHAFYESSIMNYPKGEAYNEYWNNLDLWPYDVAYIQNKFPFAHKDVTDLILKDFYASKTESQTWNYVKQENIRTNQENRSIAARPSDFINVRFYLGNLSSSAVSSNLEISLVSATNEHIVWGQTVLSIERYHDEVISQQISVPKNIQNGEYRIVVKAELENDVTPENNEISVGTVTISNGYVPPFSTPQTLSPGAVNNSTKLGNTQPTFSWENVPTSDRYELFVSRFPYGASNLVYQNTSLTGTRHTIPSGYLQNGVNYRWNMRAVRGTEFSSYSPRRYFNVDLKTPLSPPFIEGVGKVNEFGLEVQVRTPMFTWSHGEGADRYGLYISRKPYGEENLVYKIENISESKVSHSLPDIYELEDGHYRWNMSSFDGSGNESSISNTLYFTVEGMKPQSPEGNPNFEYQAFVIKKDDNSNGIVEVGEEIEFDIRVKNVGDGRANSVKGKITASNSCVSIIDSTGTNSSIPAGAIEELPSFNFEVIDCKEGEVLSFNLKITSDEGEWNEVLRMVVSNNSAKSIFRFIEHDIISDGGNEDGVVNAGEDIDFDILIENIGDENATNIGGVISSADSCVTITDNDRPWNALDVNESAENTGNFDFEVSSNCPAGKELVFQLNITSDEGGLSESFSIFVAFDGPELRYSDHVITRDIGNSDGVVNAGEDIDFEIALENYGDEAATDVRAIISSNDDCVSIKDDDGSWDNILPGDSGFSKGSFDFEVAQDCESDRDLDFGFEVSSDQGIWNSQFSVFLSDFPKPDLVVDDQKISKGLVRPGEEVIFSFDVKNIGSLGAERTTVRSYLSNDPTISVEDTELANQYTAAIDIDQHDPETETLVIDLPEGTYWLGACADALSSEKRSDNNCSNAVEITVVEGQLNFDLAIASDVAVDSSTGPEGYPNTISVGVDVKNVSQNKSVVTYIDFVIKNDIDDGLDTPIVSSFFESIEPNFIVTVTGQFLEPSIDGRYFIKACVREEEEDVNLANNCSSYKSYDVGEIPTPEQPSDPKNDEICFPVRVRSEALSIVCL